MRAGILPQEELVMCDWSDPSLGEVVTLSEACLMWEKSQTAMKQACFVHLKARKSFSGGSWLISVASLIEHYGKPEKDILSCLKSE